MSEQLPHSPYDMVGGVIYFPRMLDKIRLHARGALPNGYHNNLGHEFDGHYLAFLNIQNLTQRRKGAKVKTMQCRVMYKDMRGQ